MKLWTSASTWWKAHWLLLDSVLAVLVFVLATGDVAKVVPQAFEREPNALAYLLIIGHTLPLALRRRFPLIVMFIVCASLGFYWAFEFPLGAEGNAMFAIYTATLHGVDRRKTWLLVGIAVWVTASLATVAAVVESEHISALAILFVAGSHGAGALLGEFRYQRQQRILDLETRARRAEDELVEKARLAVEDERSRIAREMHDIVAHGMSVIVVQASAAQGIAHTNSDKTVEILSTIENVGRESLSEMRRMLNVLRDGTEGDSSLSPQPTLDDISTLITQTDDAGASSELVIAGQQRDLPAGVELAGYRIVQEALTNVRKHGGASAKAVVTVDYGPEAVTISISDDGSGAASSLGASGGGNGLIGMRERIDIYGGEFSAEPQQGGGFLVRASLPVTARS